MKGHAIRSTTEAKTASVGHKAFWTRKEARSSKIFKPKYYNQPLSKHVQTANIDTTLVKTIVFDWQGYDITEVVITLSSSVDSNWHGWSRSFALKGVFSVSPWRHVLQLSVFVWTLSSFYKSDTETFI